MDAAGEVRVVPVIEPGLHEDGLPDARLLHIVLEKLQRRHALRTVADRHRARVLSGGCLIPDVQMRVNHLDSHDCYLPYRVSEYGSTSGA